MLVRNTHFKMSVTINGVCKLRDRLLPMDDVVCLCANLSRYTNFANDSSLMIHVDLDYVYGYFDLFKEFEIMQDLYDCLVRLGQCYSFLSDDVKKEFSLDEINALRGRVYNVTLLNRI